MTLITAEQLECLRVAAQLEWEAALNRWRGRKQIVFYNEAREVLFRTACRWAELPLEGEDIPARASQVASIYENTAALGPKYWRARLNRAGLDRWFAGFVRKVRSKGITPSPQSVISLIANYPAENGKPLPVSIAAKELQSAIRPTTAVSVFITDALLALHSFPEEREKLLQGEVRRLHEFIQEVRRFYPFFPAVIAKAKTSFVWNGIQFRRGRRVILDLYGTNHDPQVWNNPYDFHSGRFEHWDESPFTLIPQGGGDTLENHRCPGEKIAIELMKVSVDFLLQRVRYSVPQQDLELAWSTPPALPRSRLVLQTDRDWAP